MDIYIECMYMHTCVSLYEYPYLSKKNGDHNNVVEIKMTMITEM
jgi:hypothetical protein